MVAAGAGELPAGVSGQRMPVEGTVAGRVLRSRRPERLTDAGSELRSTLDLLGLEADSALLVPLAFRGRSVGVLVRSTASATIEASTVTMNASSARSPPARRPRSRPRGRSRSSGCARASRRPSTSAGAGRASCTTRRCRASPRCASGSPRRMRGSEDDLRSAVETAVDSVTEDIANLRALIVELRPAALDEFGAGCGDREPRGAHAAARARDRDRRSTWPRAERRGRSPLAGAREHALPARAGGVDQRREARGRSRIDIDVCEKDGCSSHRRRRRPRLRPRDRRLRRLRPDGDARARRTRRRRARHRFRYRRAPPSARACRFAGAPRRRRLDRMAGRSGVRW